MRPPTVLASFGRCYLAADQARPCEARGGLRLALMNEPHLTFDARGALLRVRVKVRSSKSRVLAPKGGELEVALAAPPVEGAANDELIRVLAAHFAIPKSTISIESGKTSRSKLIRIATAVSLTARRVP